MLFHLDPSSASFEPLPNSLLSGNSAAVSIPETVFPPVETVERTEIDNEEAESQEVQSSSIDEPLNPGAWSILWDRLQDGREKERLVPGDLCKNTKLVPDLDRLNLKKCKHYALEVFYRNTNLKNVSLS